MEKYDVVVIGSGPGGAATAYALKDGGKRVALVEDDLWGGTCPNRGCDPKKMLVSGMEVVERNNQMLGRGFSLIESIDWPELMAFKRSYTDPFPRSFKKGVEAYGIDAIEGSARFVGDNRIEAGDAVIEADAFVIATGQRPSILGIEGSEHLLTSTDFLDMDELPKRMAFLGAGYIAFELAAIANAAGSEVTIVHHNDRPLKGFDSDLVDSLVEAYEDRGISFAFDVDIEAIAEDERGYLLRGRGSGDREYVERFDCVVGATGRIPNVEALDLENAHVNYDGHGITVDGFLQTSNPAVYACGDVVAKKAPKLTPTASFEGAYLARRILGSAAEPLAYPPIVSIVYGSPKLAQVGVSPAEAAERDGSYKFDEMDLTNWFTYRRIGEPVSKVKLVHEGDRLVGASALSSQADALINHLAILIDNAIVHEDFNRMILGSPTLASDLPSLV